MDDVALANYVTGTCFDPVEAGRLDYECARLLGVETGTPIWFSDQTLMKLRLRHGDINFSHYHHMPSILLRGFLARGRRSNLLELWWVGEVDLETMAFFVVLKATKKHEVYVSTFHRAHAKEARRLRAKAKREGRLMREQPDSANFLSPKEK